LLESLWHVIHLPSLVEEIKNRGWQTTKKAPRVHSKLFEDNVGALEMAQLPKIKPCTKHLCMKLCRFRSHLRDGKVTIHEVPTELQLADIATKPQVGLPISKGVTDAMGG
jgi:hypothetical protein